MDSAYGSADYQGGSLRYPDEGFGVMMTRVKETLDHRVWPEENEYAQRPIGEIKRMFSQPSVLQELPPKRPGHASRNKPEGNIPSYHPTRRTGWKKPESDCPPLPDPGWMPAILRNRSGSHADSPGPHQMEPSTATPFPDKHDRTQEIYHAPEPRRRRSSANDPRMKEEEAPGTGFISQRADQPTVTPFPGRTQRQQAPPCQNYETEPRRHQDTTKPAWSGSLKASGQTKAWEVNAGENIVPGGIDNQNTLQQHAAQPSTYQGRQHQQRPVREHRERTESRSETRQQEQPRRGRQRPEPQDERKAYRSEEHRDTYGVARHQPTHEAARPQSDLSGDKYKQPYETQQQSRKFEEYNPYTNLESSGVRHQEPGGLYQPQARNMPVETAPRAQYNNPGGLYSRGKPAAQQTKAQPRGPSGSGHVITTGRDGKKYFNPSESNVYQLLQEEEAMKRQRAQQHSARHQEQNPGQEMAYQGYADPMQKSPTMLALQQYVKNEGTDF